MDDYSEELASIIMRLQEAGKLPLMSFYHEASSLLLETIETLCKQHEGVETVTLAQVIMSTFADQEQHKLGLK